MQKIELLAPAGDWEALVGAINAGANAIYLAGKKFGARSSAPNFSEEEIEEAIRYAHLRNVLIYVTINTLIYDDEIEELLRYTDFLVNNHVDALIIQDLGIMDLFLHRYPDTDIHASTQMNTMNVDQAKLLKALGIKRIILAREVSIDDIKEIKNAVDIELEVFVHGALCVSYSGNCFFSSMIGGRSGNRGECAQPCRLPYSLLKEENVLEENTYLMSTKDLMTIERIDELINAGVTSMKIEGRMRKAEYVIQSVLSYRKAINNHYEKNNINLGDEIIKLKKVFNREYTEGYLFNSDPKTINNPYRPNHMGVFIGEVTDYKSGKVSIKLEESIGLNDGIRFVGTKDFGLGISRILKDNQTYKYASSGQTIMIDSPQQIEVGSKVFKTLDAELEKTLKEYLDVNMKIIFISGEIKAYVGEPILMRVIDDQNTIYEINSEYVIMAAKNKPILKEDIIHHMTKFGNTPFEWSSLVVDTDSNGFIPVKILNDLRRDITDTITKNRINLKPKTIIKTNVKGSTPLNLDTPQIIANVLTKDQNRAVKDAGFRNIYINEDLISFLPLENHNNIIVKKRRIWRNTDIISSQKNLAISDVGHLYSRDKLSNIITDEFLNVTNRYSLNFLYKMGVKRVTVSPEMTKTRIETLKNNFFIEFNWEPNLEKNVYGHEELMISKYCPIAKTYNTSPQCNLCQINQYYLLDRMNAKYPLVNDGICNIKVLHSKPLNLIDYLPYLLSIGINSLRLNFTIEDYNTTYKIAFAYLNSFNNKPYILNRDNVTTGRFLR